jgi:glycosyltransferase involved in cell wall biosynthesis
MRVCMIVRNPCVRDPRVLREARTLASAGYDVVVIATTQPGVPADEERDGFRIHRVDPVPAWVSRLARRPAVPLQSADDAAGAGGSGSGSSTRRPSLVVAIRDVIVTRQLTKAALSMRADVYHAHDLNTLAAGVSAARKYRAKLLYDAHEIYPELAGLSPAERARWSKLERMLVRVPDSVVVPSESRADEFVRRYGIGRPAVVMNAPSAGPVPDPAASPLGKLRRPGETVLVYAGGYTSGRGLNHVISAVGTLEGCRLFLAGWGAAEQGLRALVDQRGLNDRVVFLPPVAHDEVVGLVAGADIGMAPYLPVGLNNVLAAPNKLFEYLHAGIAVAGSDLPDIRRVVEAHRVGALFDAVDETTIAAAVRTITSSPGELEAMKGRAREASALYTWEAQERVLLGVYERLGAA